MSEVSAEVTLVRLLSDMALEPAPNRQRAARSYASVNEALQVVQNSSCGKDLRHVMAKLEDRWGTLDDNAPTKRRRPPVELSKWRVYRQYGHRVLVSLSHSAQLLRMEPWPLGELATRSLSKSGLAMATDAGAKTYKDWLERTGVGVSVAYGMIGSGPLCKPFAEQDWVGLGLPDSARRFNVFDR